MGRRDYNVARAKHDTVHKFTDSGPKGSITVNAEVILPISAEVKFPTSRLKYDQLVVVPVSCFPGSPAPLCWQVFRFLTTSFHRFRHQFGMLPKPV